MDPKRQRRVGVQRGLQWVLLLLAALLLTVLVRTWHGGRSEPEERGPQFLAPGEEAAVTAIELQQGRQRLRIERSGEEWRLVSPLEDLAGSRMVGELLRALSSLEVLRRIESDSLARFGLAPPRARLVLERGEEERRELWIGASSPASGQVYAAWPGLEGIAILPRFLVERFFGSELFHWREREILPPARAAIDSVRIERDGEVVRARRRAQDDWIILEPPGREADPLSFERTVAVFWRFSYTEFFDQPGAASDLGLTSPRATWIVHRGGRCDTLRIGRPLEGQGLAVQVAGRPPGRIRDDLYAFLTGGLAALEVRRPLKGDARRIDRLVIAGPEGGLALARRGEVWVESPLAAARLAACEAGEPPLLAADEGERVTDPAIDQDLRNLFEMSGASWASPLAAEPAARDYELRIHLWSDAGEHSWVFFAPDADCARRLSGEREEGFRGLAVGSRFPRRPLCLGSDTVWRWQLRLGQSREAR